MKKNHRNEEKDEGQDSDMQEFCEPRGEAPALNTNPGAACTLRSRQRGYSGTVPLMEGIPRSSREALGMNNDNSPENPEDEIRNYEEDESQRSAKVGFWEPKDGSGETVPAESDPSDPPPDDDGMPGYLEILQNVAERSELSDEDGFTFTLDEMRYLAADPEFCEIYPLAAEDFRAILREIEDG